MSDYDTHSENVKEVLKLFTDDAGNVDVRAAMLTFGEAAGLLIAKSPAAHRGRLMEVINLHIRKVASLGGSE